MVIQRLVQPLRHIFAFDEGFTINAQSDVKLFERFVAKSHNNTIYCER